ncbi:hypothetical protein DEU56DRAFT_909502 [Suillus clintonianus]|uniref:uncharacterized protein n=1 Tax=Suillus clintonianus TaxID=1904413 RepID=UPI001B86D860|nr:uncharacterized protein DEU56DRAFT_909502 [Suillus clintonianus]KAG2147521.1 hypothetical protein DEU56DRAFT_909502 [Suillus clintonianus]
MTMQQYCSIESARRLQEREAREREAWEREVRRMQERVKREAAVGGEGRKGWLKRHVARIARILQRIKSMRVRGGAGEGTANEGAAG